MSTSVRFLFRVTRHATFALLALTGNAADAAKAATPIFSAALPYENPGTTYPPVLGAVVFNQVSLNVGGGYDPATGSFTAPTAGYYFFSYMIDAGSQPGQNIGDTSFGIDGNWVSQNVSAVSSLSLYAGTEWGSASNTAIFQLKKGQKVSVLHVCCDNEEPFGWRANFMGYFIRAK